MLQCAGAARSRLGHRPRRCAAERFEDREHGGFFFTANDHETLPQRPKPGSTRRCLRQRRRRASVVAARSSGRRHATISTRPSARCAPRFPSCSRIRLSCATLQRALREFLRPRTHVVIRADADAEDEVAKRNVPKNSRATDIYVVPPDGDRLAASDGRAKVYSRRRRLRLRRHTVAFRRS